jgi:hypothetical protein
MNRFAEAVAENSQEEEFWEALRFADSALHGTDEDGAAVDEIACLLLKLEMAAYRRGFEQGENKGRHPATGCVRERTITGYDTSCLRILQGGRAE